MSEQSAKPYLVRAICEWCADNGLTPYLAVKVNAQTRVPAAFVKNGEIVLNVSTSATRKLTIDNEWIQFTARFNGASQEVAVPMAAVVGHFREGNGLRFRVHHRAPIRSTSLIDATAPQRPGSIEPPKTHDAPQASHAAKRAVAPADHQVTSGLGLGPSSLSRAPPNPSRRDRIGTPPA